MHTITVTHTQDTTITFITHATEISYKQQQQTKIKNLTPVVEIWELLHILPLLLEGEKNTAFNLP